MIDLTPTQKKTVAAALTALAFSMLVAFVLVIGWFFLKLLSFASPALTPVIVGLFLALLFKPYYEWIRSRCRNPTLSLVLMLASILVPLGLLVGFGGSFIVGQALNLVNHAPTIVGRASAWVNERYPDAWSSLQQLGVDNDGLLAMFFTDPQRFSSEAIKLFGGQYGDVAMKAGMGALKYVMGLVSWILSLLFFGYFLMRPSMNGADYVRLLPFLKDQTKEFVAKQIDAFTDILVNFFQRQVVICLIEGILYGTGFMLVGLPYGFLLGFLLGVLNLVPFLGSLLCMPLVLPISYFGDGGSLLRLIGVISVWVGGLLLDGYLITPKIQGEKTGLGYAGVIFSFVFWGVVFHSMLGLLLAIPLSAFCVVLWRALKERYIKGVI
jgi:predicted PurR-regulated permease PerM